MDNRVIKKPHIMIDIETLGVNGMFPVLQVGAICFDIESGNHYEKFLCNINLDEQQRMGFVFSQDTILWHLNNNSENFKKMISSSNSIGLFCDQFSGFIDESLLDGETKFWATSPIDYSGVSNIYYSCGRKNPIPYNTRLCSRTIRSLYEQKHPEYKYSNINTHNALYDCANQINDLVWWLRDLGIKY